MKIWQRHILGKLVKTFLFLLLSLFTLYVIVDLSVHGVRFLSKSDGADVALYYLYTFSTLLDLFLTLSLLLATLRVLFALNGAREIVALQMAGLSKKTLLLPFFSFALFLSLLCYANSQWVSPDAQTMTDAFKIIHKQKKHKSEKIHLHSSPLEDGSELVYQKFDKNELFDLFWVKKPCDIWHMKTFDIQTHRGTYVNHLTRNEAKQFEKSESYVIKDFPELICDQEMLFRRFIPLESRSISTLFSDPAGRSHLYYKLLTPLIPFLVLFAIGPISIRFSRNLPVFLIVAASIFGLISLKVILDGMLILGENQVLPAILAIGGPMILALGLSLPPFVRMR